MIKLKNGDFVFKNNISEINSNTEDITQRIFLKLSLDKGDWFLSDDGIPWTSEIFKEKNKIKQEKLIKYWIKKTIEEDESFMSWNFLNVEINDIERFFTCEFSISTKESETISLSFKKGV